MRYLPFRFLRDLLRLNWGIRDRLWPEHTDINVNEITIPGLSKSISLLGCTNRALPAQCQDLMLVVFLCCDLNLRQVLIEKLMLCQLAIPIITNSISSHELEFSLWSFRSVVLQWKTEQSRIEQRSLLKTPMHIVSFCRLGEDHVFSKSHLLNELLNGHDHPTFTNRYLDSAAKRTIADGVIEAGFYLPSNDTDDLYNEVTMFLNLRGDGFSHRKQLSFLSKASSVCVIYVNSNLISSPRVAQLVNSLSGMVLFLTHEVDTEALTQQLQSFSQSLDAPIFSNLKYASISGRPGKKDVDDLRKLLKQTLLDNDEAKSLDDLAKLAGENDVHVDEDSQKCTTACSLAATVTANAADIPVTQLKLDVLPLQPLWIKLSELEKTSNMVRNEGWHDDQCDISEEELEEKSETAHDRAMAIQDKKSCIRRQQCDLSNEENASLIISSFLKSLVDCVPGPNRHIFLQSVKLHLDEMSRSCLLESQEKWREYQDAKAQRESEKIAEAHKEFMKAEANLSRNSFSLDHIFRELGQMYESMQECKMTVLNDFHRNIEKLPDIVANLLLCGHPFELMDGDASNIPLTWVKAIFSSLGKITGNKKVFIVSVLGVQSSGKSTLLNSLFGLQFAVSAGRCTRGVYMQLIKVDKERSTLPFDYVFVIDTEGLRAPEYGVDRFDRDNAMATFVICLADVTVMNIKGENYGEIRDILQIVVRAFLRMHHVSVYDNTRHRCLFTHQNVNAVDAKSKLAFSRHTLQKHLDDMSAEAARQEQIHDVNCFSQIMSFDCDEDVIFLPDLCNGNPPMANINLKYVETVNDVRNKILFDTCMSSRQKSFLSFTDTWQHIKDTWLAILNDNFVFTFRNLLQLKAYSRLEQRVNMQLWNSEEQIYNWLATVAHPLLGSCETGQSVHERHKDLEGECQRQLEDKFKQCKQNIHEFVNNSDYHDIMAKWLPYKQEYLKTQNKNVLSNAYNELRIMQINRSDELLYSQENETLLTELLEKVKQIAEVARDMSDTNRRNFFDEKWNTFLNDRQLPYKQFPICLSDVSISIVDAVKHSFANHSLVKDEFIKKLDHVVTTARTTSKRSLENVPFQTDKLKTSNVDDFKRCEKDASKHCKSIVDSVRTHLDLCKRQNSFGAIHMNKIFKQVTESTSKTHTLDTGTVYTFLLELKEDIVFHVVRNILAEFEDKTEAYRKGAHFKTRMEHHKGMAWNYFINAIEATERDRVIADLFCDTIKEQITSVVVKVIHEKVIDCGLKTLMTKQQLISTILTELAEENSFGSYYEYLNNPKTYVAQWIEKYMNKYLFDQKESATSNYAELAKYELHRIKDSLSKNIQNAFTALKGTDMENLSSWVQEFCRSSQNCIPISPQHLNLVAIGTITNHTAFSRRINDRLETIASELFNCYSKETATTINWGEHDVFEKICERLWGCEAVCPFCGEPCQYSDPTHAAQGIKHRCLQHRSPGLLGKIWKQSQRLKIENCNFSVQALYKFRCNQDTCVFHEQCAAAKHDKDKAIYHSFRDHLIRLPHWDIAPRNVKDSSKYWVWVMSKFNKEFAQKRSVREADIPAIWKSVSKEEAVKSLADIYGTAETE